MSEILHLENVVKRFGGVTALENANFRLDEGEIVGVVGDNGAGKSSLMKIMSGVYVIDTGRYVINGKELKVESTEDVRRFGIEMVYQDFALINTLDVKTNIFLGREPIKRILGLIPRIDKAKMARESHRILKESLELDVDNVHMKVEKLSGGQRQGIAIARTLLFNPRVLILDEPTASLSLQKVVKVLELIKRLKTIGVAAILISHKLEEVFEVCDRVVVLYHGRTVADLRTAETNRDEVALIMINGRPIGQPSKN